MAWLIVQISIGRAIRFRIGLDQSGELRQVRPPCFQDIARNRAHRDLSAIPPIVPESRGKICHPSSSPADRPRGSTAGLDVPLRSRTDGDKLPFLVHLAILFKAYRMMLRLHSVLSYSPLAFPSTSVLEEPSRRSF